MIPHAATWMDRDIITLSEISQKKKGKPHIFMVFTPFRRHHYTWSLKYDTNERAYEAETLANTASRLVVAEGDGMGRRPRSVGPVGASYSPRMDGQEGLLYSAGTAFSVWG